MRIVLLVVLVLLFLSNIVVDDVHHLGVAGLTSNVHSASINYHVGALYLSARNLKLLSVDSFLHNFLVIQLLIHEASCVSTCN